MVGDRPSGAGGDKAGKAVPAFYTRKELLLKDQVQTSPPGSRCLRSSRGEEIGEVSGRSVVKGNQPGDTAGRHPPVPALCSSPRRWWVFAWASGLQQG